MKTLTVENQVSIGNMKAYRSHLLKATPDLDPEIIGFGRYLVDQ